MKITKLRRLLLFIAIISVSTLSILAEEVSKGKVRISYELLSDGGIKVINVWNNADKKIILQVDGRQTTVMANSSAQPKQTAYKFVRYDFANSSGDLLWKPTPRKEPIVDNEPINNSEPIDLQDASTSKREEHRSNNLAESRVTKPSVRPSLGYADIIYQDAFFGTEAVTSYTQKVDEYCKGIDSSKNKSQYIIDNDIQQFLLDSSKEIDEKRSNLASIVQEIAQHSKVDASQSTTINLITEALSGRLKTREEAYNKLNAAVTGVETNSNMVHHDLDENIVNYGIVGAIIILLVILTIVTIRRKKKQNKSTKSVNQTATVSDTTSDNPAIVVRRRTTSILKKQCIDDVINNPAYMLIHASDFTPDSAVRNIYIKNSCIKDVYNLYAEDLRNTENPKEDGCMVLGRWVHDEANHIYDISLEEVVFPGDDAVFKEYELNFGGKIKLRISEKLRKLRRDTNLQYDLVCWIHSHPGLGVFFSNSDDNVQMQLKHSQHPNFLIAFVVDILTSDQEMGIFTFRRDGSMNSKGDITKMYSLEEMYKWSLQSERNSFSHDNYFNILDNAKIKMPSCKGVELNNSSIIDLTQIVIEQETGIVGWAVGTSVQNKSGQEFAVSSIVRDREKPNTGVIGCLISMTHMSFPTIQRLIARDSVNISFVMVYSSKQMSLTTIPVINGELLADEQFYGDVNIDDLKIWTRRKR